MPILSCFSEITGHWGFNGTLNATIGQNLEWAWEKGDASFGTTDAFGISDINGKPANVLKFTDSDDISDFVGIEVPHGAELDEDSWLLHEYSIILDLLYPEDSTASTRALVSNEYLGQAKIKINESDKVGGASFHGKISANTWHRVAIVVSHSNKTITYYIDGAKVGEEPIGGLVDGQGKHSLEDFFYLFTTNGLSKGGYINSLQFNNMALPDSVISDLGGATAAGIPSVEPLKPYVVSVYPKPTPYLRPVSSEIQPDTEISVVWQDGQNTLTASSVKVYLNEQMVNIETARDGRQTTVKVLSNDLLLASTNYNVKVTATDSSGTELSKQWRFKVTDYRLVEASDIATKPGTLNEGFIARSAQAPAESAIHHDFKRATFQLAEILVDDLGDKVADEAIKGELEGGFDAYDLIDFEISGSAFGNFSNDDFFPGIPGSGDHDTLFATEILSYLELQKGVHTFGINVHVGKPDQNDEDQFRVFIGSNPRDYFSKSLGEFELTLLGFKDGPNDTTFDFSVEKDGLYPVRIVYWNKTRGAGLEFYSVDRETGEKILVNDLDDERAVKAFYNVSLLGTPHVVNVKPIPGSSGNNPGDPIEIILGDQSGKTDLSSIVMKINGENVEPAIVRENGIITLTQSLNLNFASQAVYDVFLSLKAKGETVPQEYAFSFNVDAKNQIKVTGYWDFSTDLNASVGNNLEYLDGPDGATAGATEFGTTDSFELPGIQGESAAVMKVGYVGSNANFGYLMKHGIAPNGGGNRVNQYTLIYDVYFTGGGNGWPSLANLDTSGDGDVFWRRGDGGLGQGGGGYEPVDPGVKVNATTWHRVVLALDLASGLYEKYVDGVYHSKQNNGGLDGRQAAKDTIWLFNDNDGENGEAFVSAIQVRNGKLSAEEIKDLGPAEASGISIPQGAEPIRGLWSFDNGDLSASVGSSLEYLDGPDGATAGATEFGTTDSFELPGIQGESAAVMKVGYVGSNANFGYLMKHGIAPNGGGNRVNQYTLIYDVYFTGGGNGWPSLANLDTSGDGDVFWRRGDGGLGQGGGGYEPVDPGVKVNANTWHRVVLALDLASGLYEKYVDGVYHSKQNNGGLDGRQAAKDTIWLFNDNDGENGEAFVSSIAVYDRKLTADEARALGSAGSVGVPTALPEPKPIRGLWSFDNGDLSASVGSSLEYLDGPDGATAGATEFGTTDSFELPGIQGESAAVMKVGYVGSNANFGYLMKHGIAPNGGGNRVNQYTLIYDVYFTGGGNGWPSLANLDTSGDGDVFWRRGDGGLGQGGGGYEPVDPGVKVNANTWHRVVLALDLASGLYEKYVDGVYHSKQNNGGLDGRQAAKDTIWLFNDNDGENGEAFVSSIAVYDRKLTADEARALGSAGSVGVPTALPEPKPIRGLWSFDNGDLSASVGSSLEYLDGPDGATAGATEFGTTDSFELPGIQGESAAVMKVGYVGSNANFGYLMKHGIAPNGGGNRVNQYTLIYDVYFTGGGNGWPSLANLDTSGDGDVFWRRGDGGLGQGGGGYEPVDPGVKVNTTTWHRVVLALDLASGLYEKYVDGVYHSKQNNGGLDGRQAAKDTIWLFNDNDGENGEAFVSSIAVYDRKLTADEATILGSAEASGIPESLEFVPEVLDLFFYQYAEGSSYNKFLEIHNPTDSEIDLSGYAFPNQNNGADSAESFDYWNSFPAGATIAPAGNFIIAHPDADPAIVAVADHFHKYLSNGDDAYALVKGTKESYEVIDVIGDIAGDDPGSGWSVAGVSNATKDHTLTRKSIINRGNTDWVASAGTNPEDSEWVILDKDVWDGIESIPTISVTREANGAIKIEFEGKLQSSANTTGPWKDIDANSPTSITPDEARQFYRTRN